MARLLRLLLPALLLLAAGPAARADAPPPPPAEIDRLIATLKDDAQRQQLIAQLQALEAAQHAAAPTRAASLLARAADQLQQVGVDIVAAASLVIDAPALVRWLSQQVQSPEARSKWIEIGDHVALIFGLAFLTDTLAGLALARLRARLAGRRPAGWPARILLLAGRLVVGALPPLVFAGTAWAVLDLLPTRYATQLVSIELIDAVLLARLLLVLAHGLLVAPREAGWTLLPLGEESAGYLYVWARRFIAWAVYGFGLVGATWWLGIPGAVYATLDKAVALVLAVLAVVFVLQNRQGIADWLRPAVGPAEAVRHPLLDLLRHRLSEIWHILVIGYIVAIFAVYAVHVEGGFDFALRGSALTVVLVIGARLLVRLVRRLARRGFAIPPDLAERLPTLESRANRYLPILTTLAGSAIWCVAGLSILEAWGVASYGWLTTDLGRRVSATLLTIAAIIGGGAGLWELSNAAIDRHLATLNGTARRTRMRTLLPLLRNALWFTLMLLVALLVMSELGLNIAPLLAGAGVVGLAVGFGSQALVKDVITGLFMLIEDTVAVGDVVDLGNQHAGVVETVSVRTIRLRDLSGTVHTVPFSEISTVKNLTKDYAYWLIDLDIAASEDPDRVVALYRQVAQELAADPAFAPSIQGELEVFGVTGFAPGTFRVQARLKTLPARQWTVGREFNRRIKAAFLAAGIQQPSASQTLSLDDRAAALLARLAQPSPAASTSA